MFWRLAVSYTLLLLAAIGLLGLVVLGRVERHYLEEVEAGLHARAVLVREAVRGLPAAERQERVAALRREAEVRITLLAEDGRVLADSDENPAQMESHADRPEVREARNGRSGTATRYSSTVRQSMMYLALRADGDGEVQYVRVALPLQGVRDRLVGLRLIVGTAAVLTGAAATALAFALARRITRPLQELAAASADIAAGGFGRKVYPGGQDEVADLARTFNHMSDRLATQFAQLEDDRQQLRAILASMTEGVVAIDPGQRVLFANDRAVELLNLPPEATAGRKFWEVVRHRGLQEAATRALAGSAPYRSELTWNDGSAVRSLIVQGVRIPGPPPRGAVLVLHDATELRKLERVRQEFVANVSHELKTPLSVIKAAVETLLDGAVEDPPARGPFLTQIADQADRLHALILDLLSLARIEGGAEALEFTAVPVAAAVGACLERHQARADAKGLILEAVPPGAPIIVWADEEALGQILDNLVDNAVKYTQAGGRIRVRWRSEGAEVVLEVEDTGIGIPAADLPRVFERFYRVDKARSRELGGTGLGLSIVKHLTQAMGGTVAVTSRVGSGTTFTVRLPRPPAGPSSGLHTTYTIGG